MKKLAVLSVTLLFVGVSLHSQAQVAQKESVKETKKEVKAEKKELRTERIALRKLEGNTVSTLSWRRKSCWYNFINNICPNTGQRSEGNQYQI